MHLTMKRKFLDAFPQTHHLLNSMLNCNNLPRGHDKLNLHTQKNFTGDLKGITCLSLHELRSPLNPG